MFLFILTLLTSRLQAKKRTGGGLDSFDHMSLLDHRLRAFTLHFCATQLELSLRIACMSSIPRHSFVDQFI